MSVMWVSQAGCRDWGGGRGGGGGSVGRGMSVV